MKKLLLLSVVFATIALPVRAARAKDARKGLQKALWQMAMFDAFYLFNLYYLQH